MNNEISTPKQIFQNGSMIAVGIIALAMPIGFLLGLLCIGCLTLSKNNERKSSHPNPSSGSNTETEA